MSSKNRVPPAPNYGPIINTMTQQSEEFTRLQRDQYEWAKQQYEKDRQFSEKVTQQQYEIAEQQRKWAEEDRARYKEKFQPMEDALIKEANEYASPERKAKEMGRAQADVAMSMEAQRQNAKRDLEAYGIDPTAARYQGINQTARTQTGAAAAAAGEVAQQNVDNTARALRSEAINVGRGYPLQYNAATQNSLNAGNASVGNRLATTASGANTMGTPTQWAGMGLNAMQGVGNLMSRSYQDQLAAYNARQSQSSGWGTALGIGAGLLSASKNSILGMFLEDGGAVPELPRGAVPMPRTTALALPPPGAVPPAASPSGGQAVDDVPARLTAGEFVLPKDVVSWLGEEKLQKLIEKAREGKQAAPAKPDVRPAAPQEPTYQSPQAIPTR